MGTPRGVGKRGEGGEGGGGEGGKDRQKLQDRIKKHHFSSCIILVNLHQ